MYHSLRICLALSTLICGSPVFAQADAACRFAGEPGDAASIQLERHATGFERPVAWVQSPDDDEAFYVVEQTGKVKLVVGNQTQPTPALDYKARVYQGANEMGLLGMAFHPDFRRNRRVFFDYNPAGTSYKTRIVEFKVGTNGRIDAASEKLILEFNQPYSNHKGGNLGFGPDGYLYIGNGDGGSANDPQGNGQNLRTLLAKMLRIDVDRPSAGLNYGIPADNPQFSDPQARREIFAYGLRNPWRWSFDRVTGELWVGDVGQDAYEEIDVVAKGGNYGWNTMEGKHCFRTAQCNQSGLTLPVVDYPRSQGASVTGGYVYRGQALPELVGAYIYADYVSGNVWSLRRDAAGTASTKLLLASGLNISSFGEDKQGELYALDHTHGTVLKIVGGQLRADTFPRTLSATGCFASLSPLTPISALVPFSVSSALWSDGAEKDRFVLVPAGAAIGFDADRGFQFPTDTVLVKNFYLPLANGQRRIIETRFLVRRDQRFSGYSYRWNDEQSEAMLLADATTRSVQIVESGVTSTFDYYYPSSGDCVRCHTASAGEALGFNRAHLNITVPTTQGPQNQIQYLAQKSVIDARTVPGDVAALGSLPALSDASQPVAARARAYLHTQCAHCHNRDNGAGQGDFDWRYDQNLAETGACDKVPQSDAGLGPDARVLKVGDAAKSVAWVRLHALDRKLRMPPVATSRLDRAGSDLVKMWIDGLTGCD